MPRLGFHDLLKQLDIDPGVAPDAAIHQGGPVEPQRGFMLHTPDWGGAESVQVGDRWVLSATLEILQGDRGGEGPDALGRRAWLCRMGRRTSSSRSWPPRLVRDAAATSLLYDCDVDSRWSDAFQQRRHRSPAAYRGIRHRLSRRRWRRNTTSSLFPKINRQIHASLTVR